MNRFIFLRMALQNIRRGRQFYLPYILTLIGTSAGFYIVRALTLDPGVSQMRGGEEYVRMMLALGSMVVAFFSAIFLFYSNSFLIKRRRKELGLYSVLGMGKRHIALMLAIETVIIAVSGIALGVAAGLLLYKLALLLLFRIVSFTVPFGFRIDMAAVVSTAGIFGAIMAATLVWNMISVLRINTVQLLSSGQTGEKEPKANILFTLAGIGCLGGGYYIAMKVGTALEALAMYFLAVFLVIIGTYCLFTSVSISVLKLLRRSKSFYYTPKHFISVSGMLYRMKRNAVGLANICILSTMVLVMVSGTVSLFLGIEDSINVRYPAAFAATVRYDPDSEQPFDTQKAAEALRAALDSEGVNITDVTQKRFFAPSCNVLSSGSFTAAEVGGANDRPANICFLLYDDIKDRLPAGAEIPGAGQALCWGRGVDPGSTLKIEAGRGGLFWQTIVLDEDKAPSVAALESYLADICYVALPGEAEFYDVYHIMKAEVGENAAPMQSEILFDSDSDEAILQAVDCSGLADELGNVGQWERFSIDERSANHDEIFTMAGSFLFLGILLGAIFIMAAVLIIYYKQVSEGYDDRERYRIMQQVGLSKKEVRGTIRWQILAVFFLPLLAAAMHVAFDFRMVILLLRLFLVYNVRLTALCTLGTLGVFAVIYALVYSLTARTYYKIVQ